MARIRLAEVGPERAAHAGPSRVRLLRFRHVRDYDGSWTEWGSMVGVPIER